MVRHQNQGFACFGAQLFGHEGTQGRGRGASQLGVVKKRGQRGFTDGWPQIKQAGRFLTAAPGAGEQGGLGHALLFEPAAQGACLLPSGRIQVALRAAVAQAQVGRVTHARRLGVAHQQHMVARAQFVSQLGRRSWQHQAQRGIGQQKNQFQHVRTMPERQAACSSMRHARYPLPHRH